MGSQIILRISFVALAVLSAAPRGGATENPATPGPSLELDKSKFMDPIEYTLGKLKTYDLVMIGERHWVKEEPRFVQDLIQHCYKEDAIDYLFLEFGNFEDQAKVEGFLNASEYDPEPIYQVLRNSYEYGWGYKEYFEIFKLIYEENKARPSAQKIEIILVDGPPSDAVQVWPALLEYRNHSPLPAKEKNSRVSWLNDATGDRDRFMADVIETHLFEPGRKGIYYAGTGHVSKGLHKKDYGRRHFKTGGLLDHRYPGRVFAITFHLLPAPWRDRKDLMGIEQILSNMKRPIAFDIANSPASELRFAEAGASLTQTHDGYIILCRNRDYNKCTLMPEVYSDDFAKGLWDMWREDGTLDRFPDAWSFLKERPPTGEELIRLMKEQDIH